MAECLYIVGDIEKVKSTLYYLISQHWMKPSFAYQRNHYLLWRNKGRIELRIKTIKWKSAFWWNFEDKLENFVGLHCQVSYLQLLLFLKVVHNYFVSSNRLQNHNNDDQLCSYILSHQTILCIDAGFEINMCTEIHDRLSKPC